MFKKCLKIYISDKLHLALLIAENSNIYTNKLQETYIKLCKKIALKM